MRRQRHLEPRTPLTAAAQMRVGGAHHVAQAVGRVRRDHLDPLGHRAVAHKLLERTVEGLCGEPLRLEFV
jgi:hypothetical protein